MGVNISHCPHKDLDLGLDVDPDMDFDGSA
jgi:hypothetical protein